MDQSVQEYYKLTEAQYTKLKKFRSRVMDILLPEHDEFYLIKWLIARQFDLKKAELMIRNNMQFKQDFDIAHIMGEWKCPEVLLKYDVGGHCGYTKSGHPLWLYRIGGIDTKGLQQSASRKDIIRRYLYKKELADRQCRSQSEKLGKRIDKAVLIMDIEDFGLTKMFKPGMSSFLHIFKILEQNYPESLLRTYILNASSIFPMLFNVVKPFMNEKTRERVVVLGSDYKERLLQDIDADQLPVHWGGTRRDPTTGDEHCSSEIHIGGEIPEEYYLKGSNMVEQSLINKIHVGSGRVADVEYEVDERADIRYTFWTESHDIEFSAHEKREDGRLKEVVRPERYSCHLAPEEGVIHCQQPGTYLFRFDNKYSWRHSKDVYYVIQTEFSAATNDTSP